MAILQLDRSEIRAEVIVNLGNRNDTNITTQVNTWAELAQQRIARRFDWFELRRETSSATITPTGTLATDRTFAHGLTGVREFHSIVRRVGSEAPFTLTELPMQQWNELGFTFSEHWDTGDIQYYTVLDTTNLLWFPIPDLAYKLRFHYSVWPTLFSGDSDSGDLYSKSDMLVALTTHLGFQGFGMLEDAARWFAIYKELETQAISQDQGSPNRSIRPMGIRMQDNRLGDWWKNPFHRRAP